MKNKNGFTVVEIMVCIVIISFIVLGIYDIMIVGGKSWNTDMGRLDLQQESRLAMDGMTRELREGSKSAVSRTDGGAKIEFSHPEATGSIKYYIEDGKFIREYPASNKKILANDASSLNFSRSGDVIEVQLDSGKTVLGKNLAFSLEEKVRMRNE